MFFFQYTQGTSYARGTTIDEYLPGDLNVKLYEKWQPEWPEVLKFSGGITAITCEMVLEVPEKELTRVFGKKDATEILEVAKRNTGR
jgi:hypothetical protein